jgi:hypothetical protein
MPVTKPTVRAVWASQAAANAITDPDIATPGYVAVGWPLTTTPPPLQDWNFILNYCMNAVQYYIRRGVPDWDIVQTYAVGDIAVGDDLIVRQSLTNNNTGNTPSTSPAFWGPMTGYATSGALGGYVTQAQLGAALAPYATTAQLNADLTNYATLSTTGLTNYYTKAAIGGVVAPYWTIAAGQAYLAANYWTSTVTQNQINAVLSGYPTLSYVSGNFTSLAFLGANYYNVNQVSSTFDTIADVNNKLASYAALASFASVLAGQGSMELPGGCIIQWGTNAGIPNSPGATVGFQRVFPHNCFVVVAIPYGQPATVCVLGKNTGGFQLINGASGQCLWIAVGN